MIRNSQGNCFYWQFDLLSCPEISHGSFTRLGGHSKNEFASLNTDYNVGDNAEDVRRNIALISQSLAIPSMVNSCQCHGNHVEVISSAVGKVICDAMVTDKRNIGLMIRHADCQACLFFDPVKKIIAAAHAGWRGLQQRILTKTILTMTTQFSCNPSNILACFSPSLGPKRSEFINFEKEWPKSFWGYQEKNSYFNLWAIAEDELKQTGILSHHIERIALCTYENERECFSYRRNKITGRLASVIALR